MRSESAEVLRFAQDDNALVVHALVRYRAWHGLRDGCFREGRHHLVAGHVGMQAVVGEFFLSRPLSSTMAREVVEVDAAVRRNNS